MTNQMKWMALTIVSLFAWAAVKFAAPDLDFYRFAGFISSVCFGSVILSFIKAIADEGPRM